MTWAELSRKIKRETKWRFFQHRTGHAEWRNPENGDKIILGRHQSQEIPRDVLEKILKKVGLK